MSQKWVRQARRKSASQAQLEADVEAPRRLVRPLGQGVALQRWLGAARNLQLPHGVVVEGGRGTGKTTILQWLVAGLLCPSELDTDEPCGMCRTCTRIANDLHPDVHVLKRAEDESDRSYQKDLKKSFYVVSIEQVRDAQKRLQRHAVEGRARVCLISDADYLAEEAQNALLKTLEEPGAGTFLLLEAARPERLLSTVRSRVQRLRVLPLPETVLRGELQQRIPHHSGRFDDIVAAAQGSLGQAMKATTEQAVQLHDLVRAWLTETQNLRPVATVRAVLEGASERRLEVEAARIFLWLMRGELRRQRDALASSAEGSYPAASLEPWTTWLERTLQAERDLELMIPPEQVLTACLVQMLA